MSEHEDRGLHVSDHMPKGNYDIPWREAKKEREK